MREIKYIILGSKGQLALEFFNNLNDDGYIYISFKEFLKNRDLVKKKIIKYKPDFLINCFADTDVENSNTNFFSSFFSNSDIPIFLTKLCNKINITLVHISSDFVHNSLKNSLKEDEAYAPLNIYGISKSIGEIYIQKFCNKYFIFRGGWLFSDQKSSFLYKLYRKLKTNNSIEVIKSEKGRPTSAKYFAKTIIDFLEVSKNKKIINEIFNISQYPSISRYDFAKAIHSEFKRKNIFTNVRIKPSVSYPSKVLRPLNSSLSSVKINKLLKNRKSYWINDLRDYIHSIK